MGQTIGYQSEVTWNELVVLHLVGVAHPTREVERIDITNCGSPNFSRQALPGLLGTVVQRITVNYEGSVNSELETNFKDRVIAPLAIAFAGNETPGTLEGDAYISGLGTGFASPDGLITREIEFTFTGLPTWTDGADA
jgi:hypothetical protein